MTYKELGEHCKNRCILVTESVKRLLFDRTKEEFSKELGIAKATLYRRLKNDNWTYSEKLIIDELLKTK